MEWESELRAERGSSGLEAYAEAEESNGSPNPMVCVAFLRISSLRRSSPTVRATVVGWDAGQNVVLAGDLKALVYYVISKLNESIPSSRSKEERIRIHL